MMWLGVVVRAAGRKRSRSIAWLLGDLLNHGVGIRRKLIQDNLARTFPEKTAADLRQLLNRIYRNQAENIIEMLRLPTITSARDARELVTVDGSALLAKTQKNRSGAVLVSAHFGNWELLGLCSGLLVTPLTIVVKPLKNTAIDRQINAWRMLHGNRIIYDRYALRQGFRALKNGEILTILGDQSDPGGSFITDFLGRRTSVFLGPAYLALKADVPLFVGMCRRTGDGRYLVESEEIERSDLTSCREDAEELARRYTVVLERYIRTYPEEWFWFHNRWKRTDPASPLNPPRT